MSTIICPSCNTPSPAGAVFCDNCGSDLRSAAPPAPQPTPPTVATPSAGESTCQSCGHANVPGAVFCENCGMQLAQAPEPQAAPQAPPPQPQAVPPAHEPPPAPPPVGGPAYEPPPAEPPVQAPPAGSQPAVPPAEQPVYEQPPQQPAPQAPPYQPPAPAPSAAPVGTTPGRLVIQGSNVSLQLPAGKQEIILGREDPVSGIFPDIDLDPHGGQDTGVGRQHAKITVQGGQVQLEDLNSVNGTIVNKQRIPPGQVVPLNNGDEIRLGLMTLNYYSN